MPIQSPTNAAPNYLSTRRRLELMYARLTKDLFKFLPARHVRYSGLLTGERSNAIDRLFGFFDDQPLYESALVAGLRALVRGGDTVVVVGGGIGVTATMAALVAGPEGRVTCFEGNGEAIPGILETAALNGVSTLDVVHAVVAEAIDVFGEPASQGAIVPPSRLPACDVLELDCEGAEVAILSEMTIRPRAILVETHGLYGASSGDVSALLSRMGYAVSDLGVAEPKYTDHCRANDIRVLQGIRA